MKGLLKDYLPLNANSSSSVGSKDVRKDIGLQKERKKDHYSHFILRLAFSSTEDLRRRFERIESALFRLRFQDENTEEKKKFVESLNFNWEKVTGDEKRHLFDKLLSATPGLKKQDAERGDWFKVDWETVPELVENRQILVKGGKAFVPFEKQMSMVLAEFGARLDKGLKVRNPMSRSRDTNLTRAAHRPCPSASRRRRPFKPNPNAPFQKLCNPGFPSRRLRQLSSRRTYQRLLNRRPVLPLPTLYAQSSYDPPEELPPQTLWTTSIHTFSKRPRANT